MPSASVMIDAGVLALPAYDETQEDVHRYIETISVWSKMLRSAWVDVGLSEQASAVLFEDELYPSHERLSSLLSSKGISEYDGKTIARLISTLLQLPSFEDRFSITDVLNEEVSLRPDILRACSGPALRDDLARCTVLMAILRKCCKDAAWDHFLILRRFSTQNVQVRAYIHAVEHKRNDFSTWPVLPGYFEGDVFVCEDFESFLEALDEDAMLLNATDDTAVNAAIRIAVFKNRVKSGASRDWESMPRFVVGSQFRNSLQRTHPTSALTNKVLRAVVETLEKVSMQATHALRRGAGGDDPQRIRERDQAQAWRRDIDLQHHLHYWMCPDDIVEFASVSFPHDDFSIPE